MVIEKSGIKRKIDEDGTNRMETSSEKCTNLEMLEIMFGLMWISLTENLRLEEI